LQPKPTTQTASGIALKPNNFQLRPSLRLHQWLAEQNLCFAFTTYQSGQVFVIGRKADDSLLYTVRTYEHAMGITVHGDEMHLGTLYQVWHFRNRLPSGTVQADYDAVFTPRSCHVTGHVAIHDLAMEDSGRLVFVSTMFNCLATVDNEYNLRPIWKPPWITGITAGDRCHINGLGVRHGIVRYVTAVARVDALDGWRSCRVGSGVIWDVVEERAVAEGQTMPHSPRWHDGRIWFINSGTGYLCSICPEGGSPTQVCFIPGFARGLALFGDYALVGTSAQRSNRTFSDLPLEQNLAKAGLVGRCAVHIINIRTGQIEHQLHIDGDIQELYDLAVLPGKRLANVIGFLNEDVRKITDVAPTQF